MHFRFGNMYFIDSVWNKIDTIEKNLNSIKNLERLQRLHQLIEQEATGSPKELASRMHISERLVYNLIEQFKEYEACICYDRRRKTYYYCDDFQFKVSISVQVNHDDVTTEVFSGSYLV